ncbi:YihY/virulence factor BrkB family protein [Streptomyces sp. NBC_01216]|uniref:YhjD/YihY/BrkB family envelope integrity protein n=1 Tax=Streptomyces sp. NBC_01216 TaxID=2903778 RepID=UPI002E0DA481|nr:YihY/virulence factor BrkB family protein [Streptomyces sp. NBC_01216]
MPPTSGASRDRPSADSGHRLRRYHRAVRTSVVGLAWNRGREMELMHRSMGFAALSLLTLVPLLIVVAAADLSSGQGFARWLVQGLGVSEVSQEEVEQLFGKPGQALQRTTAFGLAALAAFGVTFGSAVQTGYERAWDLSTARWHTMWRHVVWLAVLIAALLLFVAGPPPEDVPAAVTVLVTLGDVVGTFLFFWWSQRFLLCGRIRWRALAPGALCTALGLLGLRVFSQFVFSPLIASNAVTYGQFGTVLVLQSWLVGVGFVVYGGAMVGRLAHERLIRRRLVRLPPDYPPIDPTHTPPRGPDTGPGRGPTRRWRGPRGGRG